MSAPSKKSRQQSSLNKRQTPDWLLVFSKFLKHGKSIATFTPSSKYLARAICRNINWDEVQCIVELGAGTGPITTELVKRAKPHTRLVIVELDPDFCKRLRQKFPTVDIVEGDAAQLDQLLRDRGIEQVDHVLSGLPLPSFPASLRDSIVASSARTLAAGGTFRQLTNMPWVYLKLYKSYFDHVKFKLVPLNIPPGGVYICENYHRNLPKKG